MKVQSNQNYSTQFKAGYPVVHWVRETNGSYAPAVSQKLNGKLQKIMVRLLNSREQKVAPDKIKLADYIKNVITTGDTDFPANNARSFYNSKGGWNNGTFEPLVYLLTGKNARYLNEVLGKPIGKAKNASPFSKNTAEVNIALGDYFRCGLDYVKKLSSGFKDKTGMRYALHTKFEIIRSRTGRIKEYRIKDLRFCPEEGPNNPFIKTGYVKQ